MKKRGHSQVKRHTPEPTKASCSPRNTSEAHVVDVYYDMNFACIETGCRLCSHNVKSGWILGMSYIATRFMSYIISSGHTDHNDDFVGKSTNFISFLQIIHE